MLKHEDNPQNPSPPPSQPAAKVRVTPEELAAAITRLEARKDSHQHQADGTVAIGDVVQELSLTLSPEDIEAEINQQRAERSSVKTRRKGDTRGFRLLAVAIGIAWISTFSSQLPRQPPGMSTLSASSTLLVQDSIRGGKILRTLGEMPNDKPVLCMFDQTYNSGFTSYSEPRDAWIIIKHDGKVYLRGWTERMSYAAQRAAGKITIYDDPNNNYSPGIDAARVPITIPLDGFKCVEDQSSINYVLAADVHLDKHAYEKWNP